MNVLSLFSGIGGLDLGLQRAGMTIAEPGWYRAGPHGLERVAALDEEPEETWDLVKVELSETMTEDPLW
jgi:hypothetical protein